LLIIDQQIFSASIQGSALSIFQYEMELNYSPQKQKIELPAQELIKKNSANYIKLSANPFKHINLFVRYDQVGSDYRSDGVYFLLRNMENYDIGTDFGLFKNKLKAKVAYRLMRRNVSNENVQNDNKKWLFELRSNLRRYPNIHIV